MVTETAKAEPLLITLFLVEASASRRHTTVGMFEICLMRLWGTHLRGTGLGALSRARVQRRHGAMAGTGTAARGLFRDAAALKLNPFPVECRMGWW